MTRFQKFRQWAFENWAAILTFALPAIGALFSSTFGLAIGLAVGWNLLTNGMAEVKADIEAHAGELKGIQEVGSAPLQTVKTEITAQRHQLAILSAKVDENAKETAVGIASLKAEAGEGLTDLKTGQGVIEGKLEVLLMLNQRSPAPASSGRNINFRASHTKEP